MLFPLTAATGVTQERISLPSSSTEQAPHCARPQPNRGPCRWSSLCKTYRRGVSRLALTPCVSPFTLILRLLAIPPPFDYDKTRCSQWKTAPTERAGAERAFQSREYLRAGANGNSSRTTLTWSSRFL